ncbi:hypothetical protein EDD16DRAFT_1725230 [Pisolithus croceorrhizus]|nr:hypothetical protein EV401DRAFT_2196423 [Pisolithus croceorrhizus]KAI6123388.1 hypothetical protein EDD16DRAFT_1725230 [Pisolithus croceorrhizus]
MTTGETPITPVRLPTLQVQMTEAQMLNYQRSQLKTQKLVKHKSRYFPMCCKKTRIGAGGWLLWDPRKVKGSARKEGRYGRQQHMVTVGGGTESPNSNRMAGGYEASGSNSTPMGEVSAKVSESMMGNRCKMTWHCLNVRMNVLDHETTLNGGYMAVKSQEGQLVEKFSSGRCLHATGVEASNFLPRKWLVAGSSVRPSAQQLHVDFMSAEEYDVAVDQLAFSCI